MNSVSVTPDSDDQAAQAEALRAELADAEDEIHALRRRLQESPGRVQTLEEKLLETKGQLAQAISQNEKLTFTLQQAKEHIATLREEVEKLTQPPAAYGTFLGANEDGTVDVFSGGRKMRVSLHPDIDPGEHPQGNEVVLNESLNVVLARDGRGLRRGGDPEGGARGRAPGARLRPGRRGAGGRAVRRPGRREAAGRRLAADGRAHRAADREAARARGRGARPRGGARHHLRRRRRPRHPDRGHHRRRRAARTCTASSSPSTSCPAPKGILLYGPPGCGKTLIAKAVANSLAKKVAEVTGNANVRSYFLNIKGPELLNKYVGETERQIRLVFQRAREKTEEGVPVIVFFDEMDSLFRTRGTGISSDMESTIVPQLLAEIDGVETLRDVIVIGASNREDLIDPAILRPGRLDVKIKIERPNEEAAAQIFSRYLTADLPARRRRGRPPRRRRPGQGGPGHDRDDRGRDVPRATTRTSSSRSPTRTATRRSCTTGTSPRGP